MKYQQFLQEITERLQETVAADETVRVQTVLKNNEVRMNAISVRKNGEDVCPLLYTAPFFRMLRSGRRIEDIAAELSMLYRMGKLPRDRHIFFSFGEAKKYLAWRLIRLEGNEMLLEQLPHRRLMDFAVIYYLSLEGRAEGERGCAVVYRDYLKAWSVSEQTLAETAKDNMPRILPPRVESLDRVLEGMLLPGTDQLTEAQRIYVISNCFNFLGAAAVFYPDVLKTLSETMGDDLYLLPSSVHEFLALPFSCGIDAGSLEELVRNMNLTHLAPEEILSEYVYRYDRKKDQLLRICVSSEK